MKTCKRKKSYPEWASYKATDSDGEVYVFYDLPLMDSYNKLWYAEPFWHDEPCEYIKTKNPPKDWTKTLRKIED